jgi:hypothetical protein
VEGRGYAVKIGTVGLGKNTGSLDSGYLASGKVFKSDEMRTAEKVQSEDVK